MLSLQNIIRSFIMNKLQKPLPCRGFKGERPVCTVYSVRAFYVCLPKQALDKVQ